MTYLEKIQTDNIRDLATTLAKIHLDGFKEHQDDEIPYDVLNDEQKFWMKVLVEDV